MPKMCENVSFDFKNGCFWVKKCTKMVKKCKMCVNLHIFLKIAQKPCVFRENLGPWRMKDISTEDSPWSHGVVQLAGPGTDPGYRASERSELLKARIIRKNTHKTQNCPFFD